MIEISYGWLCCLSVYLVWIGIMTNMAYTQITANKSSESTENECEFVWVVFRHDTDGFFNWETKIDIIFNNEDDAQRWISYREEDAKDDNTSWKTFWYVECHEIFDGIDD